MESSIFTRIEQLSSKLQYRAKGLTSDSGEAEELYQHMVFTMIEKANKTPDFAGQTDAFLVQYAVWMALNKLDAERTYTRYIGEDNIITADDDGDEITTIELHGADTVTPEDILLRNEVESQLMDVVNALSKDNKRIVRMLFCGYSKTEIAKILGISKPAVSQRIATIQKTLSCLRLAAD